MVITLDKLNFITSAQIFISSLGDNNFLASIVKVYYCVPLYFFKVLHHNHYRYVVLYTSSPTGFWHTFYFTNRMFVRRYWNYNLLAGKRWVWVLYNSFYAWNFHKLKHSKTSNRRLRIFLELFITKYEENMWVMT